MVASSLKIYKALWKICTTSISAFKQKRRTGSILLTLYCSTITTQVFAINYQSHDSIFKAATDFMQNTMAENALENATIKPGRLDRRLHLKQCDKPLTIFLPRGSRMVGKTTVGVKCEGSKAWSIHVPLTVSVIKPIAVASKLLPRGTILTKADIQMKPVDLSTLPQGYIEKRETVIGQKLKRRISAGTAFSPAMMKKPEKIKRGQRVTILARSGSMEVRMTGKALSSGAVGERIKVVNIASKKKREGIITAKGEIRIDL